MHARTLGSSDLKVSAIGFGCMGLGFAYGPPVAKKDGIAHRDPMNAGASHE